MVNVVVCRPLKQWNCAGQLVLGDEIGRERNAAQRPPDQSLCQRCCWPRNICVDGSHWTKSLPQTRIFFGGQIDYVITHAGYSSRSRAGAERLFASVHNVVAVAVLCLLPANIYTGPNHRTAVHILSAWADPQIPLSRVLAIAVGDHISPAG